MAATEATETGVALSSRVALEIPVRLASTARNQLQTIREPITPAPKYHQRNAPWEKAGTSLPAWCPVPAR